MNYYEDKYYTDRTTDFARHMAKTYGLMAGGLAVTFIAALLTYLSGVFWLNFNFSFAVGLLVLEVITVIAFSALLPRASFGVVVTMFFTYALLTGISISYIFVYYSFGTMVLCFAAAAISFTVMALIGHFTKRDLNAFGRLFFAGLVGLILMSIVGIFFWNSWIEAAISIVGLILFLGITAVDTQRMRRVFENTSANSAVAKKYSVYFAMQLYLDFINIFVYLLRLLGRSRD